MNEKIKIYTDSGELVEASVLSFIRTKSNLQSKCND